MSRTDTTLYTNFDLARPNKATLAFSSNPAKITVTVSKGSQWRMPIHWHVHSVNNTNNGNEIGCESLKCVNGHLWVYRANERTNWEHLKGPGSRRIVFKPEEVVTWLCSRQPKGRPAYECAEDWSVELVVTDPNLYRNVSIRYLSPCVTCKLIRLLHQQRYLRPRHLSTPVEHTILA